MRYTKYIIFLIFTLISIFSFIASVKIEDSIIYTENCYQINQAELNVDSTEIPDQDVIQNNRRQKNKFETISNYKIDDQNTILNLDFITIKKCTLYHLICILKIPSQKINLHLLQLF